MKNLFARAFLFLFILSTGFAFAANYAFAETVSATKHPLSAWADNKTRDKIMNFVVATTSEGSSKFVRPENRIAVFDLDGTLIPEYPQPFIIEYSFQRFLTSPTPTRELNDTIHEYLVNGDLETAMTLNAKRSLEILLSTYAGDTPEQLRQNVSAWLETSFPDPRLVDDYCFKDMAYLPMLELIAYLRANGFQIYLAAGSEQEFARVIGAEMFEIRPAQVIGSELRHKFEEKGGQITISREARISDLNIGPNKALNIQTQLGRAPLIAVGNSDEDLEMLKLTTQNSGGGLGIFIHHTDAEREFAYDREAQIGKLRKGLDQAKANGWLLVNTQKDWKQIFKPLSVEEENQEQELQQQSDNEQPAEQPDPDQENGQEDDVEPANADLQPNDAPDVVYTTEYPNLTKGENFPIPQGKLS